MSAEFWMGMTIGIITALCIIFATIFFASRSNERKSQARAHAANQLLQKRVEISLRQCEAIEWAAHQLEYLQK